MTEADAKICVVHLVRAANGPDPLRSFLDSYKRHPAGLGHHLLLLLKGFDGALPAEYEAAIDRIAHQRRFIPDIGFDIDAYFELPKSHHAEFFCFLNSYSVILADGWLEKMYRALVENDAGMVGATGSWQSIFSNFSDGMKASPSYRAGYPAWKRFLLEWFPFLRKVWLRIRRRILRGQFEPFPNYHLRTNAFMLRRETALAVRLEPTRKKFDAYRFESGSRGLTRQVMATGKPILVVGRDGKAYDMPHWHLSNTFWRRNQENLLVADNQTRKYNASSIDVRATYSGIAWGPAADAGCR